MRKFDNRHEPGKHLRAKSTPADLSVPSAVYCANADCAGASIAKGPVASSTTNFSTGRIDPPWVNSYGWQGYSGQNNFLEFGKKPFVPGETGDIHGHVVYASTRPFDDPQLLLQLSWEPLVPHVRVNLYQEGFAADGVTPTLTLIDHTDTSSFDDWAQGFRSLTGNVGSISVTAKGSNYGPNTTVAISGTGTGAAATPIISGGTITGITLTSSGTGYTAPPTISFTDPANTGSGATALATVTPVEAVPNMNCPGQGNNTDSLMQDPFFFLALKDQPQWLDYYTNFLTTSGTPTAPTPLPYHSQFKCYDGMHNWNQLQPAPYDGMYSFPSVTSMDPVTGKLAGTNCTACVTNPDASDPYRYGGSEHQRPGSMAQVQALPCCPPENTL